jgi:hypothetical protein
VKTEFVKSDKREATVKNEVKTEGSVVTVKVWNDYTCYGNNVTTTPQKRVYQPTGVDPKIGAGIGAASLAVFALFFASGICDPNDPRLFDFNKNNGIPEGIATSQVGCDFATAGGTLIGFTGTLAYGATSVKSLVSKPVEEEMAAEQVSKAVTEACGSDPVKNTPLLVYLPIDKSLAYAWPDENGQAKFELTSLLDPSISSGNVLVSFATAPDRPIHTISAEELAGVRPPTWSPPATSGALTGEATITAAWYEVAEVNENVKRLTLHVKVKSTAKDALTLRARVTSDNPGLNARTMIWDSLAPGAEEEKTLVIELPKALPDASKFDVYAINKTGGIVFKAPVTNGPPAAVVAPTVPATPVVPATPPVTPTGKDKGKDKGKPK